MEAKLVELVAAKVAPLVFAESTNAYSKHVEKKKKEDNKIITQVIQTAQVVQEVQEVLVERPSFKWFINK